MEMKKIQWLTATALALVLMVAFGCKQKQEADVSDTSMTDTVVAIGEEVPGTGAPGDVNPVEAQMWLDDFEIGSELAPEGNMLAGKTGDDFAPGQKAYYAMEVGDAPADSSVKVVWYGPGETKINEESKTVTVGQKYMNFTADTKGWTKGDYRVEAWIGDEKVNTQQFNITDAGKANS
jgi:hypothetical protein